LQSAGVICADADLTKHWQIGAESAELHSCCYSCSTRIAVSDLLGSGCLNGGCHVHAFNGGERSNG
jgi:hypothetical protein